MAIDFTTLQEKIKNFTQNRDFVRNILLGVSVAAILLIFAVFLFRNITSEDYGVLYTNLSPDDAGKILTILQEEKIPYMIQGDGSIILVPKEKIYEVRLQLAAKGLPSTQNVGFEIFDEPKMGATHFQENINYIRAIEGELARTIKKIDAVKDAKVNIALPQDSIFVREEDEAKASVIISLWPGKHLNREQVKAIIFLVSHAVSKLKPENVTVVDNSGHVLSDEVMQKDDEGLNDIVAIKKKLKREIEKSIESMLARALGPQKVVVRASVDVETAQVNKKDEVINPDQVAVVSERKIQEKTKGFQKSQEGAPGTPTNVPATINTQNNNLLLDKNKKDTTTNYDITKSYIVTQSNVFKIKRISVGVLIDGKYKVTVGKDGKVMREYVPRSKEELQAYEELIKSAVGFDPKRGDKVTVISIPFEQTDSAVLPQKSDLIPGVDNRYLFIAVAALMILLFGAIMYKVLRRKRTQDAQLQTQELQDIGQLNVEGAVEAASKLHEKEESFSFEDEPVYQRLVDIAQENPDLVAEMISKWIKEEK